VFLGKLRSEDRLYLSQPRLQAQDAVFVTQLFGKADSVQSASFASL
jgi:hypothetical protein